MCRRFITRGETMDQRFSVLGLFFSILVSAENSTVVSSNASSHKPMIMDNNYPTIKMNTIFFNKKFSDFDSDIHNSSKTKKLNLQNTSRINYVAPIFMSLKDTKLKHFSQNNRFPRQVDSINFNKNKKGDTTAERYIKILLDLQPENEEDVYDYNYNQEKHFSSLTDDRNLNKEIENNSKLITRNWSESQERKRCTKNNNMENLGSRKLQLSQPLTITENIEDEKKSTLKCMDCKLLKSNIYSAEPLRTSYNGNSGLKKKNDDYFINILNQLIDKLNKSKDLKSTRIKDLSAPKSNEPISLENRSVEERIKNSSSEEELILRLEKIKGKRIMDKLNSSPETTFVNGKWVRNKILENKNNDFNKPVIDLRSEFNYTDEPISINDLKRFNLTNPENQVIDSKGDISDNFDNLQVFSTQENKEISTSPQPEENKHFSVSRATIKPAYLTSTIEDKPDSAKVDENNTLKFTTNGHTDQFNNEDKYTNPNESYETTLNNFRPTPNYESNKDLSYDLNNTLNTKNFERILESNVEDNNIPKHNNSEEITTVRDSSLAERENESSENNGYCNCNKKVVKNILSSTMIQNITEIKTDSYVSPKNLKSKSNKRSDNLQKSKINPKNITSNGILNKNDLISDLLMRKQITNETLTERKLQEPKVNRSRKSMIGLDDDRIKYKNTKTATNKSSHQYLTPTKSKIQQLLLNGQKKRNDEEKNNKIIGIQKNKLSSIPRNLQNKNPRQFVIPSKQYIPKIDDNAESDVGEYRNIDDTTGNKKISSTLSKSDNKVPNKIIGQIPSRILPGTYKEIPYRESSSKKHPENVSTKLKHKVPIYAQERIAVPTTKKASGGLKSLLEMPKKIDDKTSKYLEKLQDAVTDDVNVFKDKPGKSMTGPHKYAQFNRSPYVVGNTQRKNINNDSPKNSKIIGSLEISKSRKALNSVEKDDTETFYSADNPTDSENSASNHDVGMNSKVSKVLSPTAGTKPMRYNDSNSTLKLRKSLNDAITKSGSVPRPVSNHRIPAATINDKPFSKKQNTVNDHRLPAPTESTFFVRKTGPVKNPSFQYDTDPSVSFKPYNKVSSKSSHEDEEHAPYKHEDLEPITFDRSTDKPSGPIDGDNDPESVFQNPSGRMRSVAHKPSRPVVDDDHHYQYDDAWNRDDDELETNVDDGGQYFRDCEDKPMKNQSSAGFEMVLPRSFIKVVDDGVYEIPVAVHGFDKNGSVYVPTDGVYVPIDKPNGRHSALSLSDLLTGSGDFRYGADGRPLPPSLTASDPITVSAMTPAEATNSGKQTAAAHPIHIIQIINNGQCPDKHAKVTVKSNNPGHSDDKDVSSSRSPRFRNESQRVSSMARSKDNNNNNVIANSRQINRKFENAYDHFDSDILDRFLQVYAAPPIV